MIFINQVTGDLFADIIDSIKQESEDNYVITGESVRLWNDIKLLDAVPLKKNKRVSRIISWSLFFLQTFYYCLKYGRKQHLFFVTNPPFNMWMAPFFKTVFKCKYSLLIYDLYPDALVSAKIIQPKSFIARIWVILNSYVLKHSEKITTIGSVMAKRLAQQSSINIRHKIFVIENWVDTDFIKPIDKINNPFILENKLDAKFIISYAGSFGATHGTHIIVNCAEMLKNDESIHFLLIGGGTDEERIKKSIHEKRLKNITLLPYQPAGKFRFIAAAPDISLILIKAGAGKSIMPSKYQTALSAGCAIIASVENDCDLSQSMNRYGCGLIVAPNSTESLSDAIKYLKDNEDVLIKFKNHNRKIALSIYDRKKQCKKYSTLFIPSV